MTKILDPDLLTYIVDGSPTTQNLRFNTTTKKIRLVAGGNLVAIDGVTGQCLYTKIKQVIKADPTLIKFDLPVSEMIHDESLEIINGWDFEDVTTLKMVRDCGVAIVASNGNPTKMYACITTLGGVVSGAPYFTQSSALNASTAAFTHVNLNSSFCINELVQIYNDPNADGSVADGYDYRNYIKIFLREYGYTYDEANNTEIGYPELTYKKYNFPITHSVDDKVIANDATVDSSLPYTGMSITWLASPASRSGQVGGPYNYSIIVDGNASQNASHLETYTFIQRQLRRNADIDAGAGSRTGTVSAALSFMDGDVLKTIKQSDGKGVHIDNLAASSKNNIAESDDAFSGTYRVYPYTAAITLEFDTFLVNDIGPAKFWLWDAATYGTSGATLIEDAGATPITGNVTGASMSFSYAYSTDKPVVAVAVGTDNAKIAIGTTTILQSTANKVSLVAGKERWYKDPV
jgi:hypothetical protein